jgi:Na+/melibiose symporter-like transporter
MVDGSKSHGFLNIFSFSGGNFLQEFISTVFGGWLFFYYEIEVGLNSWLIASGYFIYAIFSAFSSPLIGFITNKNTRFTKKLGRHFPWIIISAYPWFLSLFFMYFTPSINSQNQILGFLWFTSFACSYSAFSTTFGVNFTSLFPKKFRIDRERRKASGIIGAVSFLASGLGSIFPSLLIKYGVKSSYSMMAFLSMLIAGIVALLMIPGIRENEEEIRIHYNKNLTDQPSNFFKAMKQGIKHRNFVVSIICFFFTLIIMRSVGAAFPYAIRYIFNSPALTIALISLCYLLGAIISMPIWTKIGNHIDDNRKTFKITAFGLIISELILLFIGDLTLVYLAAVIFGFFIAGFWTVLTMPINADVLDEIAANTKERNEPIYVGIRGFFMNFSIVLQSALFALIHDTTGFTEDAEFQTIFAQWGIRFTLALIPLVCTIIALATFWRFYDLNPEKIKEIKYRLNYLKI